MSEDSPAAQVGASCSTEGNEAPKNHHRLLPSSSTGNLFPLSFPTRFPSLAPAMLLCCWQPHGCRRSSTWGPRRQCSPHACPAAGEQAAGVTGTAQLSPLAFRTWCVSSLSPSPQPRCSRRTSWHSGDVLLSGAQRGQGPSAPRHPGTPRCKRTLSRQCHECPRSALPAPAAGDWQNWGRKRGGKQRALDKGEKKKHTKGGRRKAELELNPVLLGGALRLRSRPSCRNASTGSWQHLAMPAVGSGRCSHPRHVLPVSGVCRGPLLPCPVSTRVFGAPASLVCGKAPSCVRASQGPVTDSVTQGRTGSWDGVCQAAQRPTPPS